jgi:hypothetical protein
LALYEPKNGRCDFRAVVWNVIHENTVARFQADLYPQQLVRVDADGDKSLSLQCGDNAEQLSIVAPQHRRGFAGSFANFGSTAGMLLAAAVAAATVTFASPEQFSDLYQTLFHVACRTAPQNGLAAPDPVDVTANEALAANVG